MSRIQLEQREEVYRIYISDSAKAILEALGASVQDRYVDMVNSHNNKSTEPSESAEDIIARMKKKSEEFQ